MELKELGIPTKKINQLNKKGIFTIIDLIKFLPRNYYDFRVPTQISDIKSDSTEPIAIIGTVQDVSKSTKTTTAKIYDGTGTVTITWFSTNMSKFIHIGKKYIFCGKVFIDTNWYNAKKMNQPIFTSNSIGKYQRILPIYSKIEGMSADYLTDIIDKSLELLNGSEDFIDENIRRKHNLIDEYSAFKKIHKPKEMNDIKLAKKRFVFDDLFIWKFLLRKEQDNDIKDTIFTPKTVKTWHYLYNSLPFELTDDQKKCLKYIANKMRSKKRINALVQGDVGSGKTIIAEFLMSMTTENNIQSCLIAPTEVLARQHYEEIKERFKELGYKVAYLSGNVKDKDRKVILKGLEDGTIPMVVGTHAIMQIKKFEENGVETNKPSINFKNLGLVIVDEQHRFGVKQREFFKCFDGEHLPHSITMSATPIPRTLALSMYGDNIDVLSIKTRPKGRKPIITKEFTSDIKVNEFIREEINKGHQAYVICPLIEDSSSERMSEVKSVTSTYNELVKYFKSDPKIKVSLINGDMKQDEIQDKINEFANNKSNILVSTTIVEVGVNVPNATVIAIKNSERFGLAQLHQLRGRVGRSSLQSYCILQTPKTDDIKAHIMCTTTDGFEVSKKDLELRGPGDFIGTKQSGNNKYLMLMLAYPKFYESISETIEEIYNNKNLLEEYSFLNDVNLKD